MNKLTDQKIKESKKCLVGVNVIPNDFSENYDVKTSDCYFDKTVEDLFKSENYYNYIVEYKLRKNSFISNNYINEVIEVFLDLREQIKNQVYDFDYVTKNDYKNALVKKYLENEEYVKKYAILFYYLKELHIYKENKDDFLELKDLEILILNKFKEKSLLNFENLFRFEKDEMFSQSDFIYIKTFKFKIIIKSYDEEKKLHQKSILEWKENASCFFHEYKENKNLYPDYESYHPLKNIKNIKELNGLINEVPKNKLFKIFLQ